MHSEYDSYVVMSPKTILYDLFALTIAVSVVECDSPYLTLLTPSPSLELSKNAQPNDTDQTPGGIFDKLVPVMNVDVFTKATELVNDFIVEPIANFVNAVGRLDTM